MTRRPVLLTGTTSGFLDMMMSWVCSLRRLQEFNNVLIAAFDVESYIYLYQQGMPVYMPQSALHLRNASGTQRAFHYGENTYKQITKLKSKAVLEILQHGRDVIWCDPDVVTKPFEFQNYFKYIKKPFRFSSKPFKE